MPTKGHKEGCQCVVCKIVAKKARAQVPVGPTFGSLALGRLFKYPVGRLGGQVYRKCSLASGETRGTAVNVTTPIGGQPATSFEEDAKVEPW